MLIQKFGYQQLYPDLELTIMQDLDNEKLKQIPTFYFNSISTTLKEDHEGFIDFKVIELVLIICSILISLLSGSPYFIISITYQCEIYGQTLSLGTIIITLLPIFTLCSHNFKLSLKMMKYIITLWSLFIIFEVLVLLYFFFMLIILDFLLRKFRFVERIQKFRLLNLTSQFTL